MSGFNRSNRLFLRRLTFVWAMLAFVPSLWAAAPSSPRISNVQLLADQGWAADPHTIWYDSFDTATTTSLNNRYLEYDSNGGDFVPITTQALGGTGQAMRTRFQTGEVVAGDLKAVFGRNPMDYRGKAVFPTKDFTDIYWRVYLKNQLGWTGNPAKLSRAISFAGSNWSEAMIGHVWGGSGNSLEIDPASGVNSASQVVTTKYNDFDHLSWLGQKSGTYNIFDTAESGKWSCVEAHVKLNTPGNSNGIFTLYVDGQIQATSTNLNWVKSWSAYGINAVFLENYWNSGSPQLQERYFDDFVISTSYIGLAKSPVNPIMTKTAFKDADAGDTQAAWHLQIASDLTGTDTVWDSGTIGGAGLSTVIDTAHGAFGGSLTGHTALDLGKAYAARARQEDSQGNWSEWSPWIMSIQTASTVPEPNTWILLGSALAGLFVFVGVARRSSTSASCALRQS
jgi:hypothetical protein